jgi:hypothetical protein
LASLLSLPSIQQYFSKNHDIDPKGKCRKERQPLFNVDSKSKTILTINGQYSGLYSNQTNLKNKVGGVAWLLLNKGQLVVKLDKDNCRTI